MVLVAFSFLVFFEIALCLRADGVFEWNWMQVFLPLFLFDACLLFWTLAGLITRSLLERRAHRVASQRLLAKQQQEYTRYLIRKYRSVFENYFASHLSIGHDLALMLDETNINSQNVRSVLFSSSSDEPEHGALRWRSCGAIPPPPLTFF